MSYGDVFILSLQVHTYENVVGTSFAYAVLRNVCVPSCGSDLIDYHAIRVTTNMFRCSSNLEVKKLRPPKSQPTKDGEAL